MDTIQRLEQQADILFSNLSGWEQSVLKRIGGRIGKVGTMSLAEVKALNNIATVKQDMDAIIKELAAVTGKNISEVENIYGGVIADQHLANKNLYDYRGKKFVPFADNKELQSIVRAYSKTTGETMINLAKTTARNLGTLDANGRFVPLQKFYTNALDKAVMQVTSGAADFHTAMRETINALGGNGMRVNYGSGVTRRLDTTVRQALLWGAKQASNEYNEIVGEELGCDGIEIDWHSCPRPTHEFMQGKQYVIGKARTINGTKFESADEALERLQDYGCLHFKSPIICGISEPRFSEEELKGLNAQNAKTYDIDGKTVTGYEASQMMRRLETGVREQKSIRNTAQASGDALQVRRSNERIKAYKGKYEQISDVTGIAKDPKRMSVGKLPKDLTNGGNRGIINTVSENSPRKQKGGTYSVDWNQVQSKEYKERLSKVIKNEKALTAAETRARWALNNRDGLASEELYAIDLNTGADIARVTDQHNSFGVSRTREFIARLSEADKNGTKVLLIHNHPRGLPPSIGDINALLENDGVSGITVGHNGSLYYYTKPTKEIPKTDYFVKMRHYNMFDETTNIEKALESLQEQFGFTFKKL